MNRLQNFMMGRYGLDSLQHLILVVYILLSVVNMFFPFPIIVAISYVLVLIWAFRFFSRNIYQRQAENRKFLELTKPFQAAFTLWKRRFREKESRFYKCPKCRQTIRVPRGKGRISITCPKCRYDFVKKT